MSKLPPQTLPIALITQDSIRKGEGIFLLFAHIAFITSISCVRSITDISIGCQWMRQRLRLPLYPQQYPAREVSNGLFSPLCSARKNLSFITQSSKHPSVAHPLCSTCRCCNLEHSASPHNYCPSRFNPPKMLIIAFPASVSTFPAGSSPITIPESFENALAIATRWCCPLLNSVSVYGIFGRHTRPLRAVPPLSPTALLAPYPRRTGGVHIFF